MHGPSTMHAKLITDSRLYFSVQEIIITKIQGIIAKMKIMRDANTFLFLLLTLPLLLGITLYVKLMHSACIYSSQFREWKGTCMFEGIVERIFTSVALSSKQSFCLSQEGKLTWPQAPASHLYQPGILLLCPVHPLCMS